MSSAEAGAVGNCSIDYPGPAQLTFPAPPVKRSRHKSLDIVSSLSGAAKQMKTKQYSSITSAVDHFATHRANVNIDLTSQSDVTTQSISTNSREKFYSSQHRSVENVSETGLSGHSDISSVSSRPFDDRMRVLWSGQVAVNGTEICSAELLSRCHIRHML